jgi:hypothetical protein
MGMTHTNEKKEANERTDNRQMRPLIILRLLCLKYFFFESLWQKTLLFIFLVWTSHSVPPAISHQYPFAK